MIKVYRNDKKSLAVKTGNKFLILVIIALVVATAYIILDYFGIYDIDNPSIGFGGLLAIIAYIPESTASLVATGGPLMIFFLMALESSSLPIPSEVILPLSGYLIYQGRMEFGPVLVAALAGCLIGSLADYYIGYSVGMEFLYKRRWLSENALKRSVGWFNKYGGYAVACTRLLAGARTLISFPAGSFKMDIKRFLLYTMIGSAAWDLLLIYIGYLLGPSWPTFTSYLNKYFLPASLLVVVVIVIYVIFRAVRSWPAHKDLASASSK